MTTARSALPTSATPPRRTVAYLRVSTTKQEREGFSLAAQERRTRAYPQIHEWPPIGGSDDIYLDTDSGKHDERAAFQRLLRDAQAGTIARVIVVDIDRMGRNTLEFLQNDRALERLRVQRVYINQNFDTSTPVGRFCVTMFAALAELEGERILGRMMEGYRQKATEGDLWRSRPPYGYRYVKGDKAHGVKGTLAIVEEEAALVRRIFADVAAGVSAIAVTNTLNAEGVRTRAGGRWRDTVVRQMIRRTVYRGAATWGLHKNILVDPGDTKKRQRLADPAEVLYIAVDAIVEADLWERANTRLSANRRLSTRNTKETYLLGGGLITCGVCLDEGRRHTMTGVMTKNGRAYRCSHWDAAGRRRTHTLNADLFERCVWDRLRNVMHDPGTVLDDLDALGALNARDADATGADLARLDVALRELVAERDELARQLIKKRLGEDRFDALDGALATRETAVRGRIDELLTRRDAARASIVPTADVRAWCRVNAKGIDSWDGGRRQWLVRQLVSSLTAYPSSVIVDGVFPTHTIPVTASAEAARSLGSPVSRRAMRETLNASSS